MILDWDEYQQRRATLLGHPESDINTLAIVLVADLIHEMLTGDRERGRNDE